MSFEGAREAIGTVGDVSLVVSVSVTLRVCTTGTAIGVLATPSHATPNTFQEDRPMPPVFSTRSTD